MSPDRTRYLVSAALVLALAALAVLAGGASTGSVRLAAPPTSALLTALTPNGLTTDADGNVYIADIANKVVHRVSSAGDIEVVAGVPDQMGLPTPGPATSSPMSKPSALAVDAAGTLYVADAAANQVVAEVTSAGQLSILAGTPGVAGPPVSGPATGSGLFEPSALAIHGSDLFIVDSFNAVVEKVDLRDDQLSIVAGTSRTFGPTVREGPATDATFYNPGGVAVDDDGNLYVADTGNRVVSRVDAQTGLLSLYAGNGYNDEVVEGTATYTSLRQPLGLALDGSGNLYIADPGNHMVFRVAPADDEEGRQLSIVAGTGTAGTPTPGAATDSPLDGPAAVAVDGDDNLYIADTAANVVLKVDAETGLLSIFAGSGARSTPAAPTITNLPSSAEPGGDVVATVGGTSSDGETSVTSSTPQVCTVGADGTTVSFVGAGTCTLTAHVAEGTFWFAAAGAPQQFAVVAPASPSPSPPPPPPPPSPTTPPPSPPPTTPPAAPTPPGDPQVPIVSVEGSDAVGRAIAWAQLTFPDPPTNRQASGRTVLIGRDDVFADSLASGGAQGAWDAPLLLTGSDGLDPRVAAELDRLDAGRVVLLGGTAALSSQVERDLVDLGHTVQRLAGPDRVATAAEVARAVAPTSNRVVLARAFGTGEDATQGFADALAGGALAAELRVPLLLTPSDALTEPTAAYLTPAGVDEVLIVGGAAAVADEVESQLAALGTTVSRVAGPTRVATALAIAGARGAPTGAHADAAVLVDGDQPDAWADAFPAALFAGRDRIPVVLAAGDALPALTADWLAGVPRLVCGSSTTTAACTAAHAAARMTGGGE